MNVDVKVLDKARPPTGPKASAELRNPNSPAPFYSPIAVVLEFAGGRCLLVAKKCCVPRSICKKKKNRVIFFYGLLPLNCCLDGEKKVGRLKKGTSAGVEESWVLVNVNCSWILPVLVRTSRRRAEMCLL